MRSATCLFLFLLLAGCKPSGERAEGVISGNDSLGPNPGGAKVDSATTLPLPDLGYNAREGRDLFRHYCSTCHGTEGHGDGFNAYSLDPKPRNLADSTFQAQKSDEDLGAVIRSGGGVAGLSTGMPPWGRTLNSRQIDDLVAYIRTFRKPNE